MATPILQTKLYIPPLRPELVPRARLIDILNAGRHRKLTLISAPAGFGKTTLVSEWVASDGLQLAWLSLDSGDNDATRFLAYVIAALQTIKADIGLAALAGLQSPQPKSLEPVIASLINDILSESLRFVLVLDDYHLIESQAVHNLMAFLLDHLPANLHLVITSRDDPGFPLSRLRIRDELTELRATDLAFSLDETMQFFHQVMALDLSKEDVVALEMRTEGWIAGLQVAGLSMRGRGSEDLAQFIRAFTGSHRYLLDFLAEEVLERQPAPIQKFLLQTSVLDRLSGSLCDAVVESNDLTFDIDESLELPMDSQGILDYLDRANLFILALDHDRHWYRYHHLFRDFLRHRLQQQYPNLLTPLHQRASVWFEENGYIAEAIETALAVTDYEQAARLIEQVARSTVMQFGEWGTLLAWMDALPDEIIRAKPQLSLHHAWGLITNYRAEAAEARLQDAERNAQADTSEDIALRGQAAAIRSTYARLQGDFPLAVSLAKQALANLPKDDTFWRPSTSLNLATVTYLDDDMAMAKTTLLDVQSDMLAAQNFNFHLVVTGYLAQLQARRGDLDEAEKTYLQMLSFAQQHKAEGHFVSTTGMAYIGLGDLSLTRNEVAKAIDYLEQGLALGTRFNNSLILLAGHIVWARASQAQAEKAPALEHIRHAEELIRLIAVPWTWLTVSNAASLARLWLDQGNIERAEEIIQTFTQDPLPGYVREAQNLVLVRYLLATEQPEVAKPMLAEMAEAAKGFGRISTLVEVLILQAIAQNALDDDPGAVTILAEALMLAEPAGYVRLFLDEGEPMVKLLQQIVARPEIAAQLGKSDYAQRLLAAFSTVPVEETVPTLQSPNQTLLDPLTNRELDVLRLIATGLTNQEIAEQLIIAHGTVRQHINRIYSKLAVKNRTQATLAAQNLNLL